MEKEEAIDRFLKALRVALNYISLYSRDHRSFLTAVGQLRERLEELFACVNPVEIGFTPTALGIGGQNFEKLSLHKELARLFHARKIKSVRFSPGITTEELVLVLDTLAQPVKEIIKTHALSRLVADGRTPHFSAEELDYSHLLKDEGDEASDVWTYLLQNIAEEDDPRKVDEFLETFGTTIGRIKAKDLIEDEELRYKLSRLLAYIKEKDPDKFAVCSAELLRSFINDRSLVADERVSRLKDLFVGLDSEALSSVLWESVSGDEGFDTRSLEIFSLLVEREKHEMVADSLVKHAGQEQGRHVDLRRMRKMREVFALPKADPAASYIPEVYRKAIMAISENPRFGKGYLFGRGELAANYHGVLLCLLMLEQDDAQREEVFARLLAAWDEVAARRDPGYILALARAIGSAASGQAGELSRKLRAFVEEGSWGADFPGELRDLALTFTESAVGREAYLKRIFADPQPDGFIIKLFFRLFPGQAGDFYACLEKRSSDFEFMSWAIGGVREVDGAVEILKTIFALSNDLVKTEAVRAMEGLPGVDKQFLFSLLTDGNYFLKKEVLPILMKDRDDAQKALSALLLLRNPWGKNNDLLLENLSIIEEINCRAASEHLRILARKFFLFYSAPARKAKEILETWHA